MENYLAMLKFQLEELCYKFRNVDLLTKALTHSIDKAQNNPHFPLKNRTNQRLAVVGERVLTLVAIEHVILSSKSLAADQGTWTKIKSELVMTSEQTEIGKRLFATDTVNQAFLQTEPELVRVAASDWNNRCFVVPYDRIVKALFGAVFLDSGGCRGNGIGTCLHLFQKLWKPYLQNNNLTINKKCLRECFPEPELEVKNYWTGKGLFNETFLKSLMEKLKLEEFCFSNDHVLLEAIIQKSFYDDVRNDVSVSGKRLPDYERLELVGDAVLGVALAEYFWNQYPEFNFSSLSNSVCKLSTNEYQCTISKRLDFEQLVKKPNGQNWSRHGDIMESTIGAVYVSRGSHSAYQFVLDKWDRIEKIIPTSLLDLQCKLDYKFQDEQALLAAITHESFHGHNELAKETLAKYRLLGKTIVQLEVTEYVFQISKSSARAGSIESNVAYLCGKTVLVQLCEYLQLQQLVRIHSTLQNGKTPFKQYDKFVYPVLGALYKELCKYEQSTKFRSIFYRLWNPHLKQVPVRTLKECFIPTPLNAHAKLRETLGYYLEPVEYINELKGHVEKSAGYKFQDTTLLEQALTSRMTKTLSSNSSIGDCERLSVIGRVALKLFPAATFSLEEYNRWNKFEARFAELLSVITVTFVSKYFTLQLLYWYFSVPEARPVEMSMEEFDDSIFEAVLGAIFVDMSSGGDKANRKWISYLISVLGFLYAMELPLPDDSVTSIHLSYHKSLLQQLQTLSSYLNSTELKSYDTTAISGVQSMKSLLTLNVHQLRDKISCSEAKKYLQKLPVVLDTLKEWIQFEKQRKAKIRHIEKLYVEPESIKISPKCGSSSTPSVRKLSHVCNDTEHYYPQSQRQRHVQQTASNTGVLHSARPYNSHESIEEVKTYYSTSTTFRSSSEESKYSLSSSSSRSSSPSTYPPTTCTKTAKVTFSPPTQSPSYSSISSYSLTPSSSSSSRLNVTTRQRAIVERADESSRFQESIYKPALASPSPPTNANYSTTLQRNSTPSFHYSLYNYESAASQPFTLAHNTNERLKSTSAISPIRQKETAHSSTNNKVSFTTTKSSSSSPRSTVTSPGQQQSTLRREEEFSYRESQRIRREDERLFFNTNAPSTDRVLDIAPNNTPTLSPFQENVAVVISWIIIILLAYFIYKMYY